MKRSFSAILVCLLFANGCANCGEEKADVAAAPPSKPEPPVIIHPKLADGGRGRAKIVDLAERGQWFEAGVAEPPP